MFENDDLNDIPPHENLHIADKLSNTCINQQFYQIINEKKQLLETLKQQKEEAYADFETNNQAFLCTQNLSSQILIKTQSLSYLREEKEKADNRVKSKQAEISTLRERVTKKKQLIKSYQEKIEKCKDMVKRSETATFNKTNNEKDGFNILKLRLIEYEKQRVDELNRLIFDLFEIKQQKDDDILQKSTRTALKDARQTVYVNGRWILSNDHVIYRIVRSTLPTDGDYLTYFKESQQGATLDKMMTHEEAVQHQMEMENDSNTNNNTLQLNNNSNNNLSRNNSNPLTTSSLNSLSAGWPITAN